ncbi:MAG: hypothetical protein KF887_00720 [Paracoccaceae bacterium]|nr:MAG: hypothetical protein KF887_00720 [Paracoccaceae bacterium]
MVFHFLRRFLTKQHVNRHSSELMGSEEDSLPACFQCLTPIHKDAIWCPACHSAATPTGYWIKTLTPLAGVAALGFGALGLVWSDGDLRSVTVNAAYVKTRNELPIVEVSLLNDGLRPLGLRDAFSIYATKVSENHVQTYEFDLRTPISNVVLSVEEEDSFEIFIPESRNEIRYVNKPKTFWTRLWNEEQDQCVLSIAENAQDRDSDRETVVLDSPDCAILLQHMSEMTGE